MKNRTSKIMGILVTLAVLASLFAFAVPVSAGTLAWSAYGIPSATGNVIAAGRDASFVTPVGDGTTVFAVDTQAATDVILKSTNGGHTWTASSTATWGANAIVGIVVSPNFATDNTVIIAAANGIVYISTNGGSTFAQLGGQIAAGAEVITSIAISPTFSGTGEVMVGTTNVAAATYGDVYIWMRSGVQNWTAQLLAEDVTAVAFSPNYPVDFTILAVGSDATPRTRLHTKVSTLAWDATVQAAVVINAAGGVGDAAAIVSSSIAIVSDYVGSVPATRMVFVATISGIATDNIYQIRGITVTSMNSPTAGGDNLFASLAYNGTSTAGTLLAAQSATLVIYRCANPTVTVGYLLTAATAGPTGVANSSVAYAPADTTKIFVGTTGAESAVNISTNGAVNFRQTGLIDTVLNHIDDFQSSPAYATDMTAFMFTSSAAVATADGLVDSLWKTTNGGTYWERVLAFSTVNDQGLVRLSPAYATDMTVYFAETGVVGATALRFSNDGGLTWLARASTVGINDMVVKDANSIWVASFATGVVSRSSNQGWTWTASALTGAASVWKLAISGSAILAGADTGMVFLSTDGVTFTIQGGAAGIGGGNVGAVAFDSNYATNNTIYAAGTLAGLFRFVVGTSTVWSATIDGGLTLAGNIRGIAVVNGTLFAADAAVAAAAAGGVIRSLYPTTAIATVGATFEQVTTGDGLTAGYTLQSLNTATGSTVLFAIENSAGVGLNRVVTYSDTISTAAVPVITVGTITPATIAFSWTATTGATSYQLQVNTRNDFLGVAQVVTYVAPDVTASAAVAAGTTYYARVRVATVGGLGAPVIGPWSAVTEVKSQTAAPGAVLVLAPAVGAQGVTVKNTSFSWGVVAGAASYSIELADNADFTGATKATVTVNAWANTTTLKYATPYYWRVTALAANGAPVSAAIVGVFTTEAAPPPVTTAPPPITVPPPTTITITQPPATTITINPPATTVAPSETQPWVYAIIVIGAVLIIAVIVLIVRTRRVG